MKATFECRSITMMCNSLILVLFIAVNCPVMAQSRAVSGRVTSADEGIPLPGVNVLVSGSSTGTVTDADGKYSLSISESAPLLIFSFIGYQTAQVSIDRKSVIDVQLATDVTQLSEIVVTGTGVPVEKRKLSFAVESITTDKLPVVPTSSIDQALIGKIPGALISSIGGTPGSEVNIMLRGINTINRGTMPMILVDGVQMGATTLSGLDPTMIEKIEVIQGASAATIYGAQGANGVIQIFTKKGFAGKTKIEFSTSMANNEYLNIGGLRKASLHGYLTNANNEVINPGNDQPLAQDPITLLYDGELGIDFLAPTTQFDKPYDQNLKYYDHLEMIFKPSNIYNNTLRISGGRENIDYSIAVFNMFHDSNFKNDGFNNRTNLVSNIGAELVKGLKFRSVTQLVHTVNTINIWEKQDYGANGNMFTLLNIQPFANLQQKDPDGDYVPAFGTAAGANQFNSFYENQFASTNDKKIDILQNFNLTYSISKNVEVELLYGINYQDRNMVHTVMNQSLNENSNESFYWTAWKNWNDNTGEITSFFSNRTFQNFKASANVNFDFNRDFHWQFPLRSVTQVVYDYRNDVSKNYASTGLGMPITPPLTATQGSTYSVFEDYKVEFVTYGYLVNQRFEFGDLAGISGGFRTDYSSAFGKGSSPFTFPRADGFFRISGLNFWDQSKVSNAILEWKVRAAYGEAGIQPLPFDRYITLTPRTIGTSNVFYFGINQSNPDLSVEVSRELEIGTDLMFNGLNGDWLKNFQLSVSYWKRNTDNAIYEVDAPPSTGIGRVKDNVLSLESNGIQASLLASILKNTTFNWNLTTNFGKQESIITEVKGDQIIAGGNVLEAGQQVGQFFGWMMLNEVDQRKPDGEPFIDPLEQTNFEVASNGWVVDKLSKQPFISTDRYSLGDPNPTFIMSFINDIAYKSFLTFSMQLDWVEGSKLYNSIKHWMYRDGIHADYEKPITINGESGSWSAFYQGAYDFRKDKNYFIEDASFLRLRNISLGLDFSRLFEIKTLSRLQLILSGRNLWTKTKYTGFDPEVSTYGAETSTLSRGIDNGSMPNFRTYQFTLNIGF